jgi:hypothetical protein
MADVCFGFKTCGRLHSIARIEARSESVRRHTVPRQPRINDQSGLINLSVSVGLKNPERRFDRVLAIVAAFRGKLWLNGPEPVHQSENTLPIRHCLAVANGS